MLFGIYWLIVDNNFLALVFGVAVGIIMFGNAYTAYRNNYTGNLYNNYPLAGINNCVCAAFHQISDYPTRRGNVSQQYNHAGILCIFTQL